MVLKTEKFIMLACLILVICVFTFIGVLAERVSDGQVWLLLSRVLTSKNNGTPRVKSTNSTRTGKTTKKPTISSMQLQHSFAAGTQLCMLVADAIENLLVGC